MKTVEEVRKILEAVKARGDVEPTDEELPCNECPANEECSRAGMAAECDDILPKWLQQQDAAK